MTSIIKTSNDLIGSAEEKNTEMVVIDDLKISFNDFIGADLIFFVDLRGLIPQIRLLKNLPND